MLSFPSSPQLPQNALLPQGSYTVTAKAQRLSQEFYVEHIRKYIPEYFLQEHPMALIYPTLHYNTWVIYCSFPRGSLLDVCFCLLHLMKYNAFDLSLLILCCFNWGNFPTSSKSISILILSSSLFHNLLALLYVASCMGSPFH